MQAVAKPYFRGPISRGTEAVSRILSHENLFQDIEGESDGGIFLPLPPDFRFQETAPGHESRFLKKILRREKGAHEGQGPAQEKQQGEPPKKSRQTLWQSDLLSSSSTNDPADCNSV